MHKWKILDEFVKIKTKWVSFYGEHCIDENNEILEYYTVERADSIVILPFINNKLLLPMNYYRHGVKKHTLDFPGGRFEKNINKIDTIYNILQKELNVSKENVDTIEELNSIGWIVDSSFSTQRLYAVAVHISHIDGDNIESNLIETTWDNMSNILSKIECLQCRAVLMQWIMQHKERIQ